MINLIQNTKYKLLDIRSIMDKDTKNKLVLESVEANLIEATNLKNELVAIREALYNEARASKDWSTWDLWEEVVKMAENTIIIINNKINKIKEITKKKADEKALKKSGTTKKDYFLKVARFEKITTRGELFNLFERNNMGNGAMFNEVARELGLPEKDMEKAKAWKRSRPKL
jgi:hypothetical protein